MLRRLQELTALSEATAAFGFFQEVESYADPGKFQDEFSSLYEQITKMKKVMKHPKWLEWMRMTERNTDAVVTEAARTAIEAITQLEDALRAIEGEFDRLSLGTGTSEEDEPALEPEPEVKPEPERKGKKK